MYRVSSARHFDSKCVRALERELHLQLDPLIIRRLESAAPICGAEVRCH